MVERPTLAQLRPRVQKKRHRQIGNWLAIHMARPSAVYGTWLAVRIGLSAHQVTVLALLCGVAAALAIATGSRAGFITGVAMAYVAFWLDHVDGQVARWRGTERLDGVYFDYLMHHAHGLLLGFALGYGLAARTGDVRWAAAGFVVGAGWTFIGLGNDCRYKAFFQRLKSATGSFRVDGGSGGRPTPPARWPRGGLRAFTWPAYKICEPHSMLIALGVLVLLAIGAPALWLLLWRGGVLGMAALAPTLAIARATRVIMRGQVDAEFDRWFRPDSPP
jgi:hypothetical protein